MRMCKTFFFGGGGGGGGGEVKRTYIPYFLEYTAPSNKTRPQIERY